MAKIEDIRRAILAHHGGFENAGDTEIMKVWDSLEKIVQERYLKNINPPAPAAPRKETK